MIRCVLRLLLTAVALWVAGMAVCACGEEPDGIFRRIDRIVAGKRATVGVAVLYDGQLITYRDEVFPLMSVFKVPVAYAVLVRMEEEEIPLETMLHVEADRMQRDTYSPLAALYPDRDFDISIADLLRFCISRSDNNACDLLIACAGGIGRVDSLVQAADVGWLRLAATEAVMHADPALCHANSGTPSASVKLLDAVLNGGLLSDSHTAFLRHIMEETETGADKIRGGLPAGIPVGHKTGSSDRLPDGTKIGDHDVAFFLLPDGRECLLAVFIGNSRESDRENARMIAAIARFVYDYCSGGGRNQ